MDPLERSLALQREVEMNPSLATFVKLVRTNGSDTIVLHQDAFAADYQENEYPLLGKAIKYAGLFGRTIQINGKNRESIEPG